MADTIGKISTLKGELRAATQEAQSLADTFKKLDEAGLLSSAEFSDYQAQMSAAINKAAQLKDQINDTNEQINILAGGSKFEKLGNNIKDIAGKIVSLDFSGAAESANNLARLSKTITFKDAIGGIKDMGVTFLQLGKVLLTNPLFLIAAAIGAAVYAMGDLTKLIDGVAAKDEERLATLQKQAAASKEELDSVSRQEESLKAQGMSEEEILQLKIDKARVAAADAKAQIALQEKIRDEQVAAAERNKKILKGVLEFITIPLQALLYGVDQLTEKLNQAGIISDETFQIIGNIRDKFNEKVSNLVFDPEETKQKGDETVKQTIKTAEELQNTLDGLENRQKTNRQKDAKDAADKQKAIDDKKLADGMAAREAYAKANMDAQENELYELQKTQEKQLADFTGTEEERQLLIEAYAIKEQEIYDKYDQIAADADQKAREEKAAADQKAADDAEALRQKNLEAQLAANEQLKAAEEQLQAAKINAVQTGFGVLQTLFQANERAQKALFLAQKAFEAGQVIVNGIKTNGILVSQIAAAAPLLANPVTAIPAGATIAAATKGILANKLNTAASVAAIAATTFGQLSAKGGGGGGAASAGGGARPATNGFGSSSTPATPAFNLFGQGNQLNTGGAPQGIEAGQGGAQPLAITVQVSESEITSTQNFVRRVNESATL
jgi:hypothetical protein